MNGFFDYYPGNSICHKMNPLSKLVMSLVLCGACFIGSNHLFILGLILLNFVIAAIAGIQKIVFGLLKGLAKLSMALFIVQIMFIRGGHTLLSIPLINLVITDEGMSFSLLLVMRLVGAALPLEIMLSVTKINDLTNVLSLKLHVPYKYAFAVITAIRFVPIFSSEMSGIIESQTARGVQFDTKNPIKKIRLMIPMCVPLLVSSVKRIDSNAMSAQLRGFNMRSFNGAYKKYPFKAVDLVAMVVCLVIAVSVAIL